MWFHLWCSQGWKMTLFNFLILRVKLVSRISAPVCIAYSTDPIVNSFHWKDRWQINGKPRLNEWRNRCLCTGGVTDWFHEHEIHLNYMIFTVTRSHSSWTPTGDFKQISWTALYATFIKTPNGNIFGENCVQDVVAKHWFLPMKQESQEITVN